MLLKRPHLDALMDFVQQQPNLDIAIMTGATPEYVDFVLGKTAPELLPLCKFVWTRTDKNKFFKRMNGIDYKSLQYIPELESYRLDRIVMLEHNMVYPRESHLDISPFMMNLHHPEWQDQDDNLLSAIPRLAAFISGASIDIDVVLPEDDELPSR
jgi:hypothetical protein